MTFDPDNAALVPSRPRRWLVTGAAGVVGASLVARLLELDQTVVGLDDFSTGQRSTLDAIQRRVGPARWLRFSLVEGDMRDAGACSAAVAGVNWVLHQAGRGSLETSPEDLGDVLRTNVGGFQNIALAAAQAGVEGVVYASSASVYGECPVPHREDQPVAPRSAYATSKRMVELAAGAISESTGLPMVGLRYFNVLGEGLAPDSPTSVVPGWIAHLAQGRRPPLYGDGTQTRDFVGVGDVVRANLLAVRRLDRVAGRVINVGSGRGVPMARLFAHLRDGMAKRGAPCAELQPAGRPPRAHEVGFSVADSSIAYECLGFEALVPLERLLSDAMDVAVIPGRRKGLRPAPRPR